MIRFATDGWIGIISHDFTFENLAMVVQALAVYLLEREQDRGVVIGYDTRFLSDQYAEKSAQILAGMGIRTFVTDKPVVTPVLSLAVKELGAQAGVMITASNYDSKYNGLKIKGCYGGPVLADTLAVILGYIGRDLHLKSFSSDLITWFNPDPMYQNQLKKLVDLELLKNAGLKIIVDVMYGAGRGYLKELLAEGETHLIEIRNTKNPSFGGSQPAPVGENLRSVSNLLPGFTADLALALSGDGSELGVIDERGDFIDAQYVFSLLLKHLVENKKLQGGVVKTCFLTQLIDRLADRYRLELWETPHGFLHVCDLFLHKDILISGTRSGGFGFQGHIPEQDAILAGLLLMELIVVTDLKLSQLVKDLKKEFGRYFYRQLEIPYLWDDRVSNPKINIEKLPEQIAGFSVQGIQRLDGIKFYLEGGSWLLVKPARNGKTMNLYAESSSMKAVEDILHTAKSESFLTRVINPHEC